MDRNTEIKMEYADALRMVEKFEKWKKLRVEGEWYLFEQEGRLPRIHVLDSQGHLEGCGPFATPESMQRWGWKATLVKIYREREPENETHQDNDSR